MQNNLLEIVDWKWSLANGVSIKLTSATCWKFSDPTGCSKEKVERRQNDFSRLKTSGMQDCQTHRTKESGREKENSHFSRGLVCVCVQLCEAE